MLTILRDKEMNYFITNCESTYLDNQISKEFRYSIIYIHRKVILIHKIISAFEIAEVSVQRGLALGEMHAG